MNDNKDEYPEVAQDDLDRAVFRRGTRNIHKILNDNLDKINELCNAYNVKSLFAFGSVCNGKLRDNSDIDLLISFKQMDYPDYADNYFTIAEKLENLLQRPVDLVTEASLGNPYFIESVNKSRVLIYG